MRPVCIEPKKAVQQKHVRIIVVLNSAHSSLHRERAQPRTKRANIQGSHIASDLGNPVAQIFCAALDHRVRILVSAVYCKPGLGRQFEIYSDSAAFNLPKVLAQ